MARTTPTLVAAIIDLDATLVPDATPYIDAANSLVTEVCAGQIGFDGLPYPDARLELIERWLAAHFCAIADTREASNNVKGVGEQFQFRLGLNLNVTMYGQQALALDTAGGLARVSRQAGDGKRRTLKPSMSFLGGGNGTCTPRCGCG